jgi:octaprenyl-diphosphate synthase
MQNLEWAPSKSDALVNLEHATGKTGLDGLTRRLVELRLLLASNLDEVERALDGAGRLGTSLAHQSARHLLGQSGKRIRPMCVALAARTGAGWNEAARTFAVAVELVHNATLLHDDVVDVGDERRGVPAARVLYGNAASIFGGDWLLVEALRRIQATGMHDVLGRLLEVIREMVVAESLQLAWRGSLDTAARDYFDVIDGKTASLFRWAMFAGARAGGASEGASRALEAYGGKLGTSFQLVDDVLDYAGSTAETGKALLADLREGKVTYPLLVAVERAPELGPRLREALAGELSGDALTRVGHEVRGALVTTGALEEASALADRLAREAAEALAPLPASEARDALVEVARAAVERRK